MRNWAISPHPLRINPMKHWLCKPCGDTSNHVQFFGRAGIQDRQILPSTTGSRWIINSCLRFKIQLCADLRFQFGIRFYRAISNNTFNQVTLDVQTGVNATALLRFFQKFVVRLQLDCGNEDQYSGNGGAAAISTMCKEGFSHRISFNRVPESAYSTIFSSDLVIPFSRTMSATRWVFPSRFNFESCG